jgi:NTP pyrophosphatase (non-canonical NTP hydrolase)
MRATKLTFDAFRAANVARCLKWHPAGIESWSPSDWLTAVTGELGELASLIKMRNRERDGLPGNKFSPTDRDIADELADVLTYLDLLAAALGVNLGRAAAIKFNEVSERVGFPDRIEVEPLPGDTECRCNRVPNSYEIMVNCCEFCHLPIHESAG